ncbi:MAG: Gfo/Idh/MocA family oxidoreductase [Anaerolineae bacterium]|nr:Gfo/Idh/MocA family oxidoreductase [Anaerolineae bacterium]
MSAQPPLRFAAIGLNHDHIYMQTNILLEAGAQLVSYYAAEPDLAAVYGQRYPQAALARCEEEILEDPTIQLVISAGIPCDRAPLGIRVMQHGKDYMTDKPGMTTLEQLEAVRRVQAETGRIYSVDFSERFHVRSAMKAGELVQAGAIGQVLQVVILAPHLRRLASRPPWFFERHKYGGILVDIGSHQFDQVLFYTGSDQAEVVAAQVGNLYHPDYPGFEDFGDAMIRGRRVSDPPLLGYVRVDWFTPNGLGTWGDGRLFILGTDGYIEARKYCDIGGQPGGDHLFLVDHRGIQRIDCRDVALPYGRQLIEDIRNRTETAMTHAHCFLASQLALEAEAKAARLGYLK